MIEATKENLEKLKKAYQEEADTLPEYSAFGDKNDIEGTHLQVAFIQTVIDHLGDKLLLKRMSETLAMKMLDTKDEMVYNRLSANDEVLHFALGSGDTIFRDMCGD